MKSWRHRIPGIVYRINVVFLGMLFLTSGMGKLYADHRFPGLMGPVWLEDRLAEYGLSFFARFIAYAQVVTGYLMTTWSFRRLGSLLLAPMLVNIFVLTISLEWRGTPYVVGFFILQLAQIFWYDRGQYLHLVMGGKVQLSERRVHLINALLITAGLALLMLSVFVSEYLLVAAWWMSASGLAVGIWSGWRQPTAV